MLLARNTTCPPRSLTAGAAGGHLPAPGGDVGKLMKGRVRCFDGLFAPAALLLAACCNCSRLAHYGAGPQVGDDVTVEEANLAARYTGINLLATMKAELGDLDRVTRVVKLVGFVACTDDFTQQVR